MSYSAAEPAQTAMYDWQVNELPKFLRVVFLSVNGPDFSYRRTIRRARVLYEENARHVDQIRYIDADISLDQIMRAIQAGLNNQTTRADPEAERVVSNATSLAYHLIQHAERESLPKVLNLLSSTVAPPNRAAELVEGVWTHVAPPQQVGGLQVSGPRIDAQQLNPRAQSAHPQPAGALPRNQHMYMGLDPQQIAEYPDPQAPQDGVAQSNPQAGTGSTQVVLRTEKTHRSEIVLQTHQVAAQQVHQQAPPARASHVNDHQRYHEVHGFVAQHIRQLQETGHLRQITAHQLSLVQYARTFQCMHAWDYVGTLPVGTIVSAAAVTLAGAMESGIPAEQVVFNRALVEGWTAELLNELLGSP